MSALIDYFESRQTELISLIGSFVEIETPSGDPARIAVMVERVVELLRALGADVEIVTTAGGPNVLAHIRSEQNSSHDQRSLFIVGHCDTVWPAGTLARKPFRCQDGKLFGPGVFDMKSGVALVIAAIQALRDLKRQPARNLEIFFSCDEEQGSHSTRSLIEEMAGRAAAALVLEPSLPGGRVKTARKGIGQFHLTTRGRAAHAGVAPERGISAVAELAHQIIRLHALTDHSRGVSVNVGVISGGTMSNVVAAEAHADIDVRFWTRQDQEAIVTALQQLQPVLPEAEIELRGRVNRPPLERSTAIAALYEKARLLATEFGYQLGEGQTGGGSDGNFIAALGKPVLDGLGPDGDGAHAEYEHVLVADLVPRAVLVTRLLETI
jgi:glutamate carboxypeptidase